MTEDEAQSWLIERFGVASMTPLRRYVAMLLEANRTQNLISPSTEAVVWSRHIVDSAQLVTLAPCAGLWIDIGSGAGLPGLVVAILRPQPTLLVEPRRQRVTFLRDCLTGLGLTHAAVHHGKIESAKAIATVISARAVAPAEKLLQAANACGTSATRWLLPRGQSGAAEMDALQYRWKGEFHVEQSLTDARSSILVLDGPDRK